MSRPPASGPANTQSNVTNKSIVIRLPWFSQPLPRLLYPLLDQIRSLAYRDRRSFFVAFSCGSRFPARLFQIFYVSFITFSLFYSFFWRENVISNDHYDQFSCIHGIFLFRFQWSRIFTMMKEAAHASVKALSVVEMAKRMSRGEETSEMKLRWCV